MGYLHIDNLYKDLRIMEFKECYVLEKIHGTSAHVAWKDNQIRFFSGGEKHEKFLNLFNAEILTAKFLELFKDVDVILYGEAYGGKQQGMSHTYGKELQFIVFDVRIDDTWLNVPNAYDVACKMDLEFVDYAKSDTTLVSLDYWRDMPSRQAKRLGIEEDKPAEGIVIRPLEEYKDARGSRIITKHKGAEFAETKTVREVDPAKLKILEEARAISEEWVTPMRLEHVLDKIPKPHDIKTTGTVVKAMIEDVFREAKGEIVESQNAKKAIGTTTAKMYKRMLSKMEEKNE